MSGEKPATVRGPDWEEGDWGREEGEGEQERVKVALRSLHCVSGTTSQENSTCLLPATASKSSKKHSESKKLLLA